LPQHAGHSMSRAAHTQYTQHTQRTQHTRACACSSRAAFSALRRFLASAARTASRSSGVRLASSASASAAKGGGARGRHTHTHTHACQRTRQHDCGVRHTPKPKHRRA
jgi:hypothetical protein